MSEKEFDELIKVHPFNTAEYPELLGALCLY